MRTQLTRRAGVGLVVLAVGLVTAGCGSDESDESGAAQSGSSEAEKVSIAFFGPASNEPTQVIYESMRRVAGRNNADVTIIDIGFDSQKQFRAIQDATATGKYDAFVVLPLDQQTTIPVVKEAADSGIAVGIVDLPLGPDPATADPQVPGVVGSVLYPFQAQGEWMIKTIGEACGSLSPCQVAFIPGVAGLTLDTVFTELLEGMAAENADIKLRIGGDGQYTTAGGLKSAQDILAADPNVDVIASSGDQMIVGAARAVKEAGRGEEIKLIGLGSSAVAVEGIKDKSWFGSITFLPASQGEAIADIVIKAARGQKVGERGVTPELEGDVPPVITQLNTDEWQGFEPQWIGGS